MYKYKISENGSIKIYSKIDRETWEYLYGLPVTADEYDAIRHVARKNRELAQEAK